MSRTFIRGILVLLLCGAAGFTWWKWDEIYGRIENRLGAPAAISPQPDLETYLTLSGELNRHRERLATRLAAATPEEEERVLAEARFLLENGLPRLMRCWLGTPWDFHGSAHQPGSDAVACGYFVSSVLQDAGFNVEWGKLAQQPSQGIIATFLPREDMNIRVGDDYDEFMDAMQTSESGVYLVGLDSHVGFLVVSPADLRFIHSSGSPPHCVVDEARENAGTLKRSRYRVVGNITSNHAVLRSWLENSRFATHQP